jgi:hypothetical protein
MNLVFPLRPALSFAKLRIIFLFIFAFSINILNTFAIPVPDGLCIYFGKFDGRGHAYGHGFIIGDRFFSAAHVLELKLGSLMCTKGGELVDITQCGRSRSIYKSKLFKATRWSARIKDKSRRQQY